MEMTFEFVKEWTLSEWKRGAQRNERQDAKSDPALVGAVPELERMGGTGFICLIGMNGKNIVGISHQIGPFPAFGMPIAQRKGGALSMAARGLFVG
jgi:hypothetical protein